MQLAFGLVQPDESNLVCVCVCANLKHEVTNDTSFYHRLLPQSYSYESINHRTACKVRMLTCMSLFTSCHVLHATCYFKTCSDIT